MWRRALWPRVPMQLFRSSQLFLVVSEVRLAAQHRGACYGAAHFLWELVKMALISPYVHMLNYYKTHSHAFVLGQRVFRDINSRFIFSPSHTLTCRLGEVMVNSPALLPEPRPSQLYSGGDQNRAKGRLNGNCEPFIVWYVQYFRGLINLCSVFREFV